MRGEGREGREVRVRETKGEMGRERGEGKKVKEEYKKGKISTVTGFKVTFNHAGGRVLTW